MTGDYPDPLPGDFDDELDDLDSADVQVVEASSGRYPIVQLYDQDGNT